MNPLKVKYAINLPAMHQKWGWWVDTVVNSGPQAVVVPIPDAGGTTPIPVPVPVLIPLDRIEIIPSQNLQLSLEAPRA
jgi:hypothetical protein